MGECVCACMYVCMYHSNDTLPAAAEGGQVHNPCHRLSAPIYEERAGRPDILVPGSRYLVSGDVCMYGATGGQVHIPCHTVSAPIHIHLHTSIVFVILY